MANGHKLLMRGGAHDLHFDEAKNWPPEFDPAPSPGAWGRVHFVRRSEVVLAISSLMHVGAMTGGQKGLHPGHEYQLKLLGGVPYVKLWRTDRTSKTPRLLGGVAWVKAIDVVDGAAKLVKDLHGVRVLQ